MVAKRTLKTKIGTFQRGCGCTRDTFCVRHWLIMSPVQRAVWADRGSRGWRRGRR